MTVQIDLWHIVSLVLTGLGGFITMARWLVGQYDRRSVEREAGIQKALVHHLEQEEKAVAQMQALERDFLRFQADMPLNYVRREDYIRGQSVIEAKLDALAGKLEIAQLKGLK